MTRMTCEVSSELNAEVGTAVDQSDSRILLYCMIEKEVKLHHSEVMSIVLRSGLSMLKFPVRTSWFAIFSFDWNTVCPDPDLNGKIYILNSVQTSKSQHGAFLHMIAGDSSKERRKLLHHSAGVRILSPWSHISSSSLKKKSFHSFQNNVFSSRKRSVCARTIRETSFNTDHYNNFLFTITVHSRADLWQE